jgi:flagellar basal body-associated protein FliL
VKSQIPTGTAVIVIIVVIVVVAAIAYFAVFKKGPKQDAGPVGDEQNQAGKDVENPQAQPAEVPGAAVESGPSGGTPPGK